MKTYTIYGPPGTGKTTEMLNRVEKAKSRYSVNEICYLSFTKAGAAEVLKRLNIPRSDRICTIHSLMYRLNEISAQSVVDTFKLRKFGDKTGFTFKNQANDTGEEMGIGDKYLFILSKSFNRMSSKYNEYYESDRPGNYAEFDHFCSTYSNWKMANGYVDFNDMLQIYLENPVPHGAKIIFIDEAQDLSNLQWAVIEKMIKIGEVEEIHIAGDDDQAIYEWNGANTHGMLQFEEKYNAERVVLNQSWRIPKSVYGIAMSVIGQIKNRVDKEYLPKNDTGEVVRYSMFSSGVINHGEDTLILCRNFVTRKEVESELIKHRIPYKNEGGMGGLFNTRLADAIRVFNKLSTGESITQAQIDKMIQVSDERTRKELTLKNFTGLLNRGFLRSFNIPPNQIEFYREADMMQDPTIRISTIHSAKGREADHVVVHTGLTQKTINDMEINPDAEARVFYVAVTRAKNKLTIVEGDANYRI